VTNRVCIHLCERTTPYQLHTTHPSAERKRNRELGHRYSVADVKQPFYIPVLLLRTKTQIKTIKKY